MSSVLIVEDYVSIKGLYAQAFSRAGFEVETAASGNEGLKKVAERDFDIIILDVLMLELSGSEFLEKFEPAKHSQTQVVVVSNLDSQDVVEKMKGLGAVDYLVKSQYTPEQLVETIQARLSQ
jgi:DNA-binding response OmpR family regulator